MQRINFFHENVKGLTFEKIAKISGGLVCLLALIVGIQHYRVYRYNQSLEIIQAKIQAINAEQGIQAKNLQAGANPVENVTLAMTGEPGWPEVLDVVSESISEGIWLTDVHGESKDGGEIVLKGTAYQARLVPGFLDRLRSRNVFSRVDTNEISFKAMDAPLEFNIKARTRGR